MKETREITGDNHPRSSVERLKTGVVVFPPKSQFSVNELLVMSCESVEEQK